MKKIVCLFFLYSTYGQAQNVCDILIRNGKIMDGTGNSWYYGDIAIAEGKILRIGKIDNIAANRIIDATGLVVSPGFIDVHTHIEGDFKTPTANNFIHDGVTTVVTGNCGASRVETGKFLHYIDSLKLSINVATLIGHNDVRKTVMGTANRLASEEELQKMEELVRKGMLEGAVGFSTGLIYIPGTYSSTGEIIRLAKVASQEKGIYATHMRSEADSVVQAIAEAIHIAKESNIPLQISHFKISGHHNWKRSTETLALVHDARKQGIEVTIDQYPYTASSTSLSTMLPDEILSDGQDSIKARLKRPEEKKYAIEYMLKNLKKRKLKHFGYAVVGSYRADSTLNGKSIEQINLLRHKKHKATHEAETIIDMILHGGAGMVFHGMSEWDVKNIMLYPFNMFASDAGIRTFGQGVPHPRGYGTNARILGKYVREEKILSLEEAIRRMTSLPAQKFQFNDRGLLREGMAADIVAFDEKQVTDKATFEKPHAYSQGFKYVLVNGKVVVENGNHTGIRPGKPLYGQGYLKSGRKKF